MNKLNSFGAFILHTIANPFFLYIYSFGLALVVYTFGWSGLFPELEPKLLLFFALSFVVSATAGYILIRSNRIVFSTTDDWINPLILTGIIYILFIIEFVAYKGVPLFMVLSGQFDKTNPVGVKSLHPLIVTFSSFYTVYLFHQFISRRTIIRTISLVLMLLLPLLYLDRGALLIILTSMFFVLVLSGKILKQKIIAALSISVVIFLAGFGMLGNLREARSTSNEHFMNISLATEKFNESPFPKEVLWTYMYIASPLANLQSNINAKSVAENDVKSLIATEFIPDFISKRIAQFIGAERAELSNISADFTVGTTFARSYVLMGWTGIWAMFLVIMLFQAFLLFTLKPGSRFFVTGVALLCTFSVYGTFTNMIYFSGMSFQLFYPVLLNLLSKGK